MRVLRAFFVALLLIIAAEAQTPPSGRLVLVLPFDNQSKLPGIDWITESFPEVLSERISSAGFFLIGRQDRLYAFDRLGLPATVHPSRATTVRLAQEMDIDYVILGSYNYDGTVFSASAQILDVKNLRLHPPVWGSGPLPQLLNIQSSMAWDLLHDLDPHFNLTREAFVNATPPVRLDAFEDYLRGVIAPNRLERISYLKQALKLNPNYPGALLQLGQVYFDGQEYEPAQLLLSRVPQSDPLASEANFLLGLAYYYTGNDAKAEEAFQFVKSRFPLTEVLNNLGVINALRGNASATDYLNQAIANDPNDADYKFNMAVVLLSAGDKEGAQRQLKDCLALQPNDGEAKALLESLTATASAIAPLPEAKQPELRIKKNYDQTTFLEAELELQQVTKARLATADPQHHAAGLVEIGRHLLVQGFPLQAERDLREAVALDANSAPAHLAMAEAKKALNDVDGARAEAGQAITLHPSAEAYVLLAQIDRDAQNLAASREDVAHALQLEPSNPDALSLERTLNPKPASGVRHNP